MLAENAVTPRDAEAPLLECRGMDVCVGPRLLVRGLDLAVGGGSMLALLGPNGCGKSLTLHTLAGLRQPKAGELLVCGRPLRAWPRRAPARELALLPHHAEEPFAARGIPTAVRGARVRGRGRAAARR